MVKYTLPIPTLTGGVSTQPEPLRLPQQAEVSTNAIASVVEGLRRRPPTEYQGSLVGYAAGTAGVVHHPIHSDDGDYVVVAGDGTLQVYDMANLGQPLTIRDTSGGVLDSSDLSYLSSTDPQADYRFTTLSEFTLVMNRTKTVQASSVQTSESPNQALVSVISGNYRSRYEINIKYQGSQVVNVRFETASSDGKTHQNPQQQSVSVAIAEDSIRTDRIAEELHSLLTSGVTTSPYGGTYSGPTSGLPPATWDVRLSGSSLLIRRNDAADFEISISESQGSSSLRLAYKEVQLFSDLPVHAPTGMKIEVKGDPSSPDAGYWAEFAATQQAMVNEFADGYWRECVKGGISEGVDPLTMPHALIRQANGEFQWTPLDGNAYVVSGTPYDVPKWTLRTAGDDSSNKHPSFVGKTIRDMCFHEGRLGLLSESSLTLSETREPFSFYRTTVTDVLDTERIELDSGNVQEEQLSHAVSLGADIVLFADGTQFVVRADGAFTPNTISLITAGKYDSNPDAAPLQVRDSLFVATDRTDKGCIHELFVAGDRRPQIQQVDITASAANYVPRVRSLATSPQLEMVICTSDDDQGLYAYTHFFNDGQRIAQAWQKFTFAGDPTLRHAWFHDTELYLILEYATIARVFKMRMAPYVRDGANTLVHLDERIDQAQCTRALVGSNTAIQAPFFLGSDVLVIEKATGKTIRVVSVVDDVVLVAGDHTSTNLWIGRPIAFRHDLSKVRSIDENQRSVIATDLTLDSGVLYYEDSGPFDVMIMPDDSGETSYTERFTGPYLGIGANYQSMRVTSGRFPFSIRGRGDTTRISIRSSDPWPLRVVNMDIRVQETRLHGQRR